MAKKAPKSIANQKEKNDRFNVGRGDGLSYFTRLISKLEKEREVVVKCGYPHFLKTIDLFINLMNTYDNRDENVDITIKIVKESYMKKDYKTGKELGLRTVNGLLGTVKIV
jgi:hypothetical protein